MNYCICICKTKNMFYTYYSVCLRFYQHNSRGNKIGTVILFYGKKRENYEII